MGVVMRAMLLGVVRCLVSAPYPLGPGGGVALPLTDRPLSSLDSRQEKRQWPRMLLATFPST